MKCPGRRLWEDGVIIETALLLMLTLQSGIVSSGPMMIISRYIEITL